MLVLGIVLGIVVLFTAGFAIVHFQKAYDKQEKVQNRKHIDIAYDGFTTQLENAAQCHLCGSSNKSLMSYYRKFDSVGLISLNDWYIVPFQLKTYNEYESEAQEEESSKRY